MTDIRLRVSIKIMFQILADETFNGLTSSMKRKSKLSGNIGNHSFSELMEKERKTANFTLLDEIAKDIINVTCYKIFKY